MKRLLRYFTYTIICAIIALAVLLIAASTQTFQKKALQYFASKHLEHFEVADISVRLGGIDLSSVVMAQGDAVVKIPSMHIKWDRSSLLRRDPLHIKLVDIQGFYIDIPDVAAFQETFFKKSTHKKGKEAKSYKQQYDFVTHTETAYATPIIPTTPFAKHFRLDKLDIAGKAKIEDQNISLKAFGKDLGSYQQGRIRLDVKYNTDSEESPITAADFQTELNVIVNEEGLIQKIILDSSFMGHSRLLNAPAEIKLQGLIEPSKSGEHYTMNMYFMDAYGNESPLFDLDANLNVPENRLHAKYKGYGTQDQILPFLTNNLIPNFNLQYEGVCNYDFSAQEFHCMETGGIDASDFGQVNPVLLNFEDVHLAYKVDFKYSPQLLDVRVLDTVIQDKQGATLLAIQLNQPFKLHIKDQRVKLTQAEGDILRIQTNGFPIAYLSPFFPSYEIKSDPLSMDLILSFNEDQSVHLRANRAIELNHLSLSKNNTVLLQDISLYLLPEASYQDHYLNFAYKPLKISTQEQPILNTQGNVYLTLNQFTPEVINMQGTLAANITLWLQQNGVRQLYAQKPINQTAKLTSNYEFTYSLDALSIKQLSLKLTDNLPSTHKEGFLNVELKQPIMIPLDDPIKHLYAMEVQGELLTINLQNFPIALVEPFIPESLNFKADKLTGFTKIERSHKRIMNNKEVEGLSFKMDEPINLTHVYFSAGDQAYLSGVHLSFFAEGFLSEDYIEAKWQDLLIAQTSLTKLPIISSTGTIKVLDENVQFIELEADVDLPQLLAQPSINQKSNLNTGLLRIYAQTSPQESRAFKANLQLKNIELIRPAKHIDTITMACQGTISKDNTIEFMSPLSINGPSGTSDLKISGLVKQLESNKSFDIQVEGSRIELNDVLLLGKLMETEGTPAASSPSKPSSTQTPSPVATKKRNTTRDSRPFWYGIQGELQLNVQTIAYAQFTVDQLFAKAKVTNKAIDIEKLNGSLLDAPFDFSGNIIFNEKDDKPYTLKSKASLQDLNMGLFLVQSEFAKEPPIDGIFSVATNAYSNASNLDTLLEVMQGDFQLQGRNGKLYTYSSASDTVKVGTQVVRVAGAIFGSQVKELDFLSQVVDFFKEIPFYQVNIQAKRGADLNIDIYRFLLEGPEVYLTGMGQVTYQENVPISNQPLDMTTRIDAKGKAASLINSLGLLKNDINKQGYYIGPEFHVKGTAGKPSFTEFYNLFSRPRVSPSQNQGPDQESIFNKLGLPISNPKKTGTQPNQNNIDDPVKGIMNLFGL